MTEDGPNLTPDAGSSPDQGTLLNKARAQCAQSQNELFESCRVELVRMAEMMLDSDVRPKVGASDIVQEAIIKADRGFTQFRGMTIAEFKAWMRKILLNTLLNAQRDYVRTGRRRLSVETPLDTSLKATIQDMGTQAPDSAAVASEMSDKLEQALAKLSEEYQTVVRLRNQQHLTFSEIGVRMSRSEDAARMLWGRAFEKLAGELEP